MKIRVKGNLSRNREGTNIGNMASTQHMSEHIEQTTQNVWFRTFKNTRMQQRKLWGMSATVSVHYYRRQWWIIISRCWSLTQNKTLSSRINVLLYVGLCLNSFLLMGWTCRSDKVTTSETHYHVLNCFECCTMYNYFVGFLNLHFFYPIHTVQ